jgi:hypothetical protein
MLSKDLRLQPRPGPRRLGKPDFNRSPAIAARPKAAFVVAARREIT